MKVLNYPRYQLLPQHNCGEFLFIALGNCLKYWTTTILFTNKFPLLWKIHRTCCQESFWVFFLRYKEVPVSKVCLLSRVMTPMFLERPTAVDNSIRSRCVGLEAEISETNILNPGEMKLKPICVLRWNFYFFIFTDIVALSVFNVHKTTSSRNPSNVNFVTLIQIVWWTLSSNNNNNKMLFLWVYHTLASRALTYHYFCCIVMSS